MGTSRGRTPVRFFLLHLQKPTIRSPLLIDVHEGRPRLSKEREYVRNSSDGTRSPLELPGDQFHHVRVRTIYGTLPETPYRSAVPVCTVSICSQQVDISRLRARGRVPTLASSLFAASLDEMPKKDGWWVSKSRKQVSSTCTLSGGMPLRMSTLPLAIPPLRRSSGARERWGLSARYAQGGDEGGNKVEPLLTIIRPYED